MTLSHSPLPACLQEGVNEAGCDEAGRGCLAGPVFAAAVILPDGYSNPRLNDSKQLSEKRRMSLREEIMECATAWAIASVDAREIDEINILRASIEAMHRALAQLKVRPGAIIVDGNRFTPFEDIPWQTVVKGDGKYANIAAASILAKTERDLFMLRAHEQYPNYGWDRNKGYPTAEHKAAVASHGTTPLHRLSFKMT